jgi:hypothetical protein
VRRVENKIKEQGRPKVKGAIMPRKFCKMGIIQ